MLNSEWVRGRANFKPSIGIDRGLGVLFVGNGKEGLDRFKQGEVETSEAVKR